MKEFIRHNRDTYVRRLLQIGLAFVLIYAGIGALTEPLSWKAYTPSFLPGDLRDIVFQISTWGELFIAGWLLSGKKLAIPSFLMAIFLALIIGFNWSQLDILFRNVGLLFAALALGVMSLEEE